MKKKMSANRLQVKTDCEVQPDGFTLVKRVSFFTRLQSRPPYCVVRDATSKNKDHRRVMSS